MVHQSLAIKGIASAEVPSVWDEVKPMLMPAVHKVEMDDLDLFEALWNADMQLWVGIENEKIICAMTTRIDTHEHGKVATILHVGGRFEKEFTEYLPRLKQWAKASGADYLRLIGRPAWSRKLKEHFETNFVMMESRLCQ